jgi:predicted metal-dependent phosphoesterase TrpH
MHILGYFPDKNNYLNIKKELDIIIKGREERNLKIINKLNELGIEINMEEVKKQAVGYIVGRPHIARVLAAKGYVRSIDDTFDKYLSKYGKAYFRRFELKPEMGIAAIRKAGGIPVLAHPIFLRKSFDELDKLLSMLKGFGLAGIEAYYSENKSDDTGNILRLAIKHELLVTGGSDFHGTLKQGLQLGRGRGNLRVPYELFNKLIEKTNKL